MAQDYLDDEGLPRYHRIKLLIVTIVAVEDRFGDVEVCKSAKQNQNSDRKYYPLGQ